mmetsp:Transcript_1680/g.2597  ORF Transcript_1680/g.2597 Transcript_1680/m.2597 type:complete len:285 (-) Transcript_1680:453-1307(-)
MVKNKTLATKGLLVLALGNQSAHLPGNSYCKDYLQFVFSNNHTVFGLFFFNPLHPIRYDIRVSSLVATLMLSFALFNALYYYVETLEKVSLDGMNNMLANVTGMADTGTLAISAIGAALMVIVDFIVCFYVALPCCLPGHSLGGHSSSRWIGKYVVVLIALALCVPSFILALGETTVGVLIVGGLILFAISIFGFRILVSSAIFLWTYKRDYKFYEAQLRGISGTQKGESNDDSDYSVQERDIEAGSDATDESDSSSIDSDSEAGSDDDGSVSDGDYSTDESGD